MIINLKYLRRPALHGPQEADKNGIKNLGLLFVYEENLNCKEDGVGFQ